MKPITIQGGGVAGLALGIGLRQAGVPVTLLEAGRYPRHRVCGEFISGAGTGVLQRLELDDLLLGASVNETTAWSGPGGRFFSARLPKPALGLSRYQFDRRLAERFVSLGGKLRTGETAREEPGEGTIRACGRRGGSRHLIALKLHCRRLQLDHDLEMHLGSHGYVGLSRVEEDRINICGLFRSRRQLRPGKAGMMAAYLCANGLSALAARLAEAEVDPASVSATTALDFSGAAGKAAGPSVGDARSAIPPFAGNGISMALESAAAALPHLTAYASGDVPWPEMATSLRRKLDAPFRRRLAIARLLHPLLLQPAGRGPLTWAVSRRALPFHLLYRLLR